MAAYRTPAPEPPHDPDLEAELARLSTFTPAREPIAASPATERKDVSAYFDGYWLERPSHPPKVEPPEPLEAPAIACKCATYVWVFLPFEYLNQGPVHHPCCPVARGRRS